MTTRNFRSLFAPSSVALLGASPQPGSVGLILIRNLMSGGFRGPVWLVNPKYREIEGHPCYPSIEALPAAPDLAVVATPPQTVPPLIAELGRRGTRAAVVITAGIRGELEQAMLKAAQPHLLRIQGPNCLGLMLPRIGLNASFAARPAPPGDLAFVSQSGALVVAVVDWAAARGIGFSQVVSVGEMADVDFGDLFDYLAADTQSRAILVYMEAVTRAPKFMSGARRAARSKPVIVVKAGRHEAGAKAALSHTGALAGADRAYDAAFRRAGLLRVIELQQLFDAAQTLARLPLATGERLMILTNGGGAGVLAADSLADADLPLPQLSPATMTALDAVLPATWSRGNPVDIIGDAGPERYSRALEALLAEPAADAILVINCPTALASSGAVARAVVDVIARHRKEHPPGKPALANWLGEASDEGARQVFAAAGIPEYETPARAVDGFLQLVRYGHAQEQLTRTPPSLPEDIELHSGKARSIIAEVLAGGRTVLSEVEAKALLSAYGIPAVPTDVARDAAEAGRLAERLLTQHGAVVIKILSDDITHKSDVGGVRLGLEHADEVRRAAEDILARVSRLRPEARVKGFTVQPMIRRPRAQELIAGMTVDRIFGPMVLFGAGGTAVEVLRDTAQGLPPLDRNLALALMQETRVWRLLQGYRDRPPAAIDAIADVLVRLSYLVARHAEIRELDINPLLADDQGVLALDARVRVADEKSEPRVAMAIRPYPSEWVKDIEIESVGTVRLRPIRPDDEALYQAFFEKVSEEDRRMRFFSAHPDLSHRFLARLTQIDYAREMAFAAIDRSTGQLLGVVRLVADSDYEKAEYGILVRSDVKGRGLGWALMQHLIAYARSEGMGELFGFVLATNTSMLEMCSKLGFSIATDAEDPTLRKVVLGLRRGGAPA